MDNKILNRMAVQILDTEKPEIKLSASNIISPLTTNRNNPNVMIVIGNVKITKMCLTNKFKMDITAATIIAVV